MHTPSTNHEKTFPYITRLQDNITEFMTLEKTILKGEKPDSPKLLFRYLALGETYTKDQPKEFKIRMYNRILNILLETVCDTYIAQQWRDLCLNYCNKPLASLSTLAETAPEKEHLRKQLTTFKSLSHYFYQHH